MKINFKNILICIGVIIVTYMCFDIALRILKINYTLHLITEESTVALRDDEVYSDISNVLRKYFRCIRNEEIDKLRDMSLYYAKMDEEEYLKIKEKLNISEIFEIVYNNISVLDKEIYLCDLYIKNQNSVSENVKVVLKLNREEGYFRVLNFKLESKEG